MLSRGSTRFRLANPRLEALIDGTTATGWHQFLGTAFSAVPYGRVEHSHPTVRVR